MAGYKYRFAYARKIIKKCFINAPSLPFYSHRHLFLEVLNSYIITDLI